MLREIPCAEKFRGFCFGRCGEIGKLSFSLHVKGLKQYDSTFERFTYAVCRCAI